jgi:hypothetical protein
MILRIQYNNSFKQDFYDYSPQMPFEEEYSQSGCMGEQQALPATSLVPYED